MSAAYRVRVFGERPVADQTDAAGPFADERASVGEKNERPRDFQTLNPRGNAVAKRTRHIYVRHRLGCRTDYWLTRMRRVRRSCEKQCCRDDTDNPIAGHHHLPKAQEAGPSEGLIWGEARDMWIGSQCSPNSPGLTSG